jgi:hypothetical protein
MVKEKRMKLFIELNTEEHKEHYGFVAVDVQEIARVIPAGDGCLVVVSGDNDEGRAILAVNETYASLKSRLLDLGVKFSELEHLQSTAETE